VLVRQLPDRRRFLMAYDLASGWTRQLVALGRDDRPTVDPTGISGVMETSTGPLTGPSSAPAGTASHLELIDLVSGVWSPLTPATEGVFDTRPVFNRAGDGWVYFLRSDSASHGETAKLLRVDPNTGAVQAVLGSGVGQFALEPGGLTALVYAGWCLADGSCGGAWRLDLSTGRFVVHPFDPVLEGALAWTADGSWFAHTQHAEASRATLSYRCSGGRSAQPRRCWSGPPAWAAPCSGACTAHWAGHRTAPESCCRGTSSPARVTG